MLFVKSFQFSPIQENTYVLYNEFNDCVIIDPGCYFDEEKTLLNNFIAEKKIIPKLLLNTHCHLDHVFGNKMVAEKYGLVLHLHRNEKLLLDYAPTSGLMYNLPFDNYIGDYMFLEDNEEINFGNDTLKILLTPGHSPGSVSFYSKENKFVISGDVLFKNSIGRADLPGGNYDELIKSIKEKLLVLPAETVVYSGHGEATTIGKEKTENGYLV